LTTRDDRRHSLISDVFGGELRAPGVRTHDAVDVRRVIDNVQP
jgi:hypothetical protein